MCTRLMAGFLLPKFQSIHKKDAEGFDEIQSGIFQNFLHLDRTLTT